ncbi:ExeM/NucH family extracellular endonuclease [Beggiatoa leptomitoformis]|uniref:ExeM/NucH family extracellular endonuclease n=1 Tax=Beggiatoa leptomitoformis TaxID=288004 RepID=A0A2N9YI59_9GAMM|nr:ExeM/NucH family extracellular endonuclease [Beggiatoa leptomitoformis]AUI70075.1 ExeM/NucH family extracellular endonuclease [Beggiatoa leptomitoformis]QGX03640.1 ExeM/NucH family extracellular endonuclease [Beggiatoa leptomitoformis]
MRRTQYPDSWVIKIRQYITSFSIYTLIIFGFLAQSAMAAPKLLISGYLANPQSTDSPYEYVQLIAVENIDFSVTPHAVVFTNNGTATSNGWVAGGALTYGFNLTTGTLNAGDIVYVGGSGKLINGSGSTDISSATWLNAINTATTAGNSFGTAASSGVLGNGGGNADGIAIFDVAVSSITASTVPVDAVFFGTGVGSAKPATGGYTLPTNDLYDNAQGTFGNGTNTFIFSDPAGSGFTKLTGVYNTNTATWTTARTGSSITLSTSSVLSDITTAITLATTDTAPTVISSVPSDSATNVATSSTITLNFDEPVDLTAAAVTVECPTATAQSFTGLPANNVSTVILTPSTTLPNTTSCTVTVIAGQVTDKDGTADNMATNQIISFTTIAAPVGTAPSISFGTNTDDYIDGGVSIAPASPFAITAALNDSTDAVKNAGIDFIIADSDGIATTSVTASSSNSSVVPNTNLTIAGSGTAAVNVKINPVGVGYSTITVTVSDGTNMADYVLNYAVSAASTTPTTTRFHSGKADASSAIAIDTDYMLVADDEDQTIRLYNRANSGLPVASFDFTSSLGLSGSSEVDIEASTRVGNSLYWLGSHSNNSSGNDKPNRERLFTTTLSGTGTTATLTFEHYYKYLEDDLIAWDSSNAHGLGANFFGLSASAAAGVIPETTGGFNIEGFSIAPNSTDTVYLAFRAPIVPTNTRTKALIIPVTNFTTLGDASGGVSGSATFGAPIQLELGGRGIRSMECNTAGCLLIAGSADGTGNFKLYTWSGNALDTPDERSTNLPIITDGSYETIVALPTGATLTAWDNQDVQFLIDTGDMIYYADGTIAKDLPNSNHKKFRSEIVNLGTPPVISKIHTLQGNGAATSLTGTQVIEGIVVGDFQGSTEGKGFYVQEEDADIDADVTTSEGIFVYCNTCTTAVSVGDKVRVTGTISEYSNQTQLGGTLSINVLSTGNSLPSASTVTLPVPSAIAGVDYLERFEGMLVIFSQTLYVSSNYTLGRYGEILLSANGRLSQPTNVTTPGVNASTLQAQNLLNQITLDDGLTSQNPDPAPHGLSASHSIRGGDTVTGLSGILNYNYNLYRVQPTASVSFIASNPRTATPTSVGGTVKVASFNVLNYFNTFTACTLGVGGTANNDNCRGATDATEFARQRAKTIAAIQAINADIVGIMEMENDGYDASSALQDLVNGLNSAMGADTYSFIDPDTALSTVNVMGTDAIKVALIYKSAVVTPAGAAMTSTDAIFDRRPLAQTFQVGIEKFTVIVNHFKSKGSCPTTGTDTANEDSGDGQSCWNAKRQTQATTLLNFIDNTVKVNSGDDDILIIGDLNSYAEEDPITLIKAAGYTNLVTEHSGVNAYGYQYDGLWGYLDHALSSASLTPQINGVTDWHINADEPISLDYNTEYKSAGQLTSLYAADGYRSSDHDPVVIGLTPTVAYQLSLTTTGTGTGTISSSGTPAGTSCGTNCLTYVSTSTVNLQATPTGGASFSGWSCTPTFVSGNTLTANTICAATFTAAVVTPVTPPTSGDYSLAIKVVGTGSGTISGTSAGNYPSGTRISLTALANADSDFIGWSPSTCAATFVLDVNTTCTATFDLKVIPQQYTLSLTTTGTGSGVISGANAGTYPSGTLINLSAIANSDSQFIAWNNALCASPFNLTADTVCIAQFESNPVTPPPPTTLSYTLYLQTTGTGTGMINGTGAGMYPNETLINLNAIANSDSQFITWNNALCASPFTLTADTNCIAQFDKLLPTTPLTYTLTVTPSPFGTVQMASVTCPDDCSVIVDSGTILSLNAIANTGYQFIHWTGDASCGQTVNMTTNIHCEAVFMPITTTTATTPLCPLTGTVNTLCNAQLREITQALTVLPQGNISNLVIATTVLNQGWLSNILVKTTGRITGGILTGYVHNQGILTDIDFKGGYLQGGILAGVILNSSLVDGYIANVRFMENATLTGGILQGRIYGNPNAPAMLNNVRIKTGSHLSGVILGENVIVEDNVIIDKNIILPRLDTLTAYDATGKVITVDSQFVGGISVLNQAYVIKTTQKLADTVNIRGRIFVAPEHVGKTADLFVYSPYWYADNRFISYFMTDSKGQIFAWDEKPLNLIPFKQSVVLEPIQEMDLYTGHFVAIGTLKVVFGYRLSDGTLVMHNEPSTIHIEIQP